LIVTRNLVEVAASDSHIVSVVVVVVVVVVDSAAAIQDLFVFVDAIAAADVLVAVAASVSVLVACIFVFVAVAVTIVVGGLCFVDGVGDDAVFAVATVVATMPRLPFVAVAAFAAFAGGSTSLVAGSVPIAVEAVEGVAVAPCFAVVSLYQSQGGDCLLAQQNVVADFEGYRIRRHLLQ